MDPDPSNSPSISSSTGIPIFVIATIAHYLLLLYFFILVARLVLDLARNMSRGWRPTGFGLLVSEFLYLVTDPPLKFARRIIPNIRIGGFALDLSFTAVMFVDLILISVASAIAAL